jgi:hypothetical protein
MPSGVLYGRPHGPGKDEGIGSRARLVDEPAARGEDRGAVLVAVRVDTDDVIRPGGRGNHRAQSPLGLEEASSEDSTVLPDTGSGTSARACH